VPGISVSTSIRPTRSSSSTSSGHLDPAARPADLDARKYSRELEAAIGPFFTKGLPGRTMAVDHGVLDDGEFLQQDDQVLERPYSSSSTR